MNGGLASCACRPPSRSTASTTSSALALEQHLPGERRAIELAQGEGGATARCAQPSADGGRSSRVPARSPRSAPALRRPCAPPRGCTDRVRGSARMHAHEPPRRRARHAHGHAVQAAAPEAEEAQVAPVAQRARGGGARGGSGRPPCARAARRRGSSDAGVTTPLTARRRRRRIRREETRHREPRHDGDRQRARLERRARRVAGEAGPDRARAREVDRGAPLPVGRAADGRDRREGRAAAWRRGCRPARRRASCRRRSAARRSGPPT